MATVSHFVRAYGGLTERNPWTMAFVTCTGKGMIADAMSQTVIESKPEVDWHRNLVFGFYGGWYCGWFQHFLYNIVYTRMFGAETTVFNALRKVAFDSAFHVPLVCFPVYYAYKAVLYDGETASAGLKKCREEVVDMSLKYYAVWIPANALVFTVVPVRFRIGFVATTSLGWLTIASFFTHQ